MPDEVLWMLVGFMLACIPWWFERRRYIKVAANSASANSARDEICHDGLHFDIGVIPGTSIYRCYRCGWEGKLSPVA